MIETIIIGTGFGGLCMGAKLSMAERHDFLILEKAESVGGTWRENTYPGAECDIASAYYSYSFWPNPTWDFKWAKQKQILNYLNDFTDAFDLRRRIRFRTDVVSATWKHDHWEVGLRNGDHLQCRFLVSAVGQLHHTKTPEFKGRDCFKGIAFHSAQWDHSVELRDKNIAVIGNAASAIQLIPELAKISQKLTVYHRSANWILPKPDRAYTRLEKWLGRRLPFLAQIARFNLWAQGEFFVWPTIKGNPITSSFAKAWNQYALKKYIKDPELRKKMTPIYPIGAKRILLSDKIYPTLARDNVENVTAAIDRFNASGIQTTDGVNRAHDVVVFATGFQTRPFLKDIVVRGKNGLTLDRHWKNGAKAYHGVITAGFPNMFMLYGPNTNSGHTSIVFKIEQQVSYILQLMTRSTPNIISVKPSAEIEYDREMQQRLSRLNWNKVDASWYKDGDKITRNWPGSTLEYKRRMKTPIWADYEIT